MKNIIILLTLILFFSNSAWAQVDENLAKNTEVVLRIQSGAMGVCDKYCWQEVEILEELRNPNNYLFEQKLNVAFYSWEKGIPSGVATIYLEKYNIERNDLWKLVGGKRMTGVSHYEQREKGKLK